MTANSRQANGVTIVDLKGDITIDEGSRMLRTMVRGLADQGSCKILLNLRDVTGVDYSGLGELIAAYTTVRASGGDLRLLNLPQDVEGLLQVTKLSAVFEIEENEAAAIAGFDS
jgi:anti-sigma B factor antagonist